MKTHCVQSLLSQRFAYKLTQPQDGRKVLVRHRLSCHARTGATTVIIHIQVLFMQYKFAKRKQKTAMYHYAEEMIPGNDDDRNLRRKTVEIDGKKEAI